MKEARKLINEIIDFLYLNAHPGKDCHDLAESGGDFPCTPAWEALVKAKRLKDLMKDMEV